MNINNKIITIRLYLFFYHVLMLNWNKILRTQHNLFLNSVIKQLYLVKNWVFLNCQKKLAITILTPISQINTCYSFVLYLTTLADTIWFQLTEENCCFTYTKAIVGTVMDF
ncbi:hypothetical protein V8G54_011806 [Vigna mungo]|uniref:Uncharacterized protein n=1 Tax=Vigna mungo TaxID=3915 RepID=A0AAQ3NQT1_VIGMU